MNVAKTKTKGMSTTTNSIANNMAQDLTMRARLAHLFHALEDIVSV